MRASEISAQNVAGEAVAPATAMVDAIFRDIARAGLAGLLTGVLVVGPAGRLVMRAAALLVPSSVGEFTENGNRIGSITLGGSLALILVGLFFGLLGSVVWVTVSPWLPRRTGARVALAAPTAVALTGVGLIHGSNPDFAILGHDVATVVLLLALVAVAGAAMAAFDAWLDRRLPPAGRSAVADTAYRLLVLAGAVLIVPPVLGAYLGSKTLLGAALVATGIATLIRWSARVRRRPEPRWLETVGRAGLLAAVVVGTAMLTFDVAMAVGWR